MNQEERREKRQDDFKHAVVVVAVFVITDGTGYAKACPVHNRLKIYVIEVQKWQSKRETITRSSV
jgi:hypothetical protein